MNYAQFLRTAAAHIVTVTCFATQGHAAELPGLPDVLPADVETEIALSAGPKHLRAEASVYLLRENGYELAREGTNGFSCLVIRGPGLGPPQWDDSISGWCFDEHGLQTIGRTMMDRAKYRRQGMSPEDIRNKVNAGFASGDYRAPDRAGVIYMLSPINKVIDHRTGGLFDYVPHLMYYAPNITNDDIGVPRSQHTDNPDYVWSGLPFLPTSGPHGFFVQALGEKESRAIFEEYEELIARVRQFVDIQPYYQ